MWTPKDFFVIRTEKDQDFINAMIEKCDSFWKEVILPELMTRSIENSTKSIESVPGPSNIEKTYCFCKTTDVNREMVGCDRCDQWFHPKCLKLKKLPTTKSWYCPSCETKNLPIKLYKIQGQKKLSIYNEDYINLVKDVMPQIVTFLELLSQLQAAALQLY